MIFNAAPQPLKDFTTGNFLPVQLIVAQTGTPDDFGGNNYPNAGTPAYNLFNGIVDVGNSGIPGIRNSSSTSVTLTFTNLNPANFYKFRGAVVRGNNYVDRWSVFSLQGVDSFTDAHVDASANNNLITISEFPTATLTNGQVAINSGENREGSLVAWDDIAPGADGTFSIRAEQYMGPTPFGNTANAAGAYGYGFTAIYLEEVIGTIEPIAITNQPQNITVNERDPIVLRVGASGSPIHYYWYRNGVLDAANNLPTYTIPSAEYPANNAEQFYVVLSNSVSGAVQSDTATVTVVPDTTPPTIISAVGDIDPSLVHVTFSEPMDPAFVNEGNIAIFVTGTGPGDYFTYSVVFTNGTNATIMTDPRVAGQNYTLEALDLRDASSGNNIINPNPLDVPIRPTVELIGFDANNEWKYFVGSDIFGSGWEQPGYDDSAWGSGPAGLGLDSSANGVPILTTIPYTGASEPTWYRKHFTFPGTVAGAVLTLRDVVEDGAVYYLNGQEVYRHNVNPGTLTYATRSATTQVDPTPIQGPFNIPTTSLVAGDNVLAVVVIQAGSASTDVELAVQLTATIEAFAGGAPHITVPPQNETVGEGGNVTLSVAAEGALPLSYQWRHGGTDVPGATASSYTILGARPSDGGSYTVFISNSEGSTNSQPVTLTVVPDTSAPTIVSVAGDTNLSVVTVTLHDEGTGMDLAKAQNPANYQIALTAGGGTLTVVSAVATNIGTNTVVTLATSAPRVAGQNYKITITGVTDASVAANPVTPNSTGITATVVLSAFTSVWRYDQSGNDLGTAWKDVGYNDSAWPSGPGVLGFETSANTLTFLQSIAAPNGTNTVLSLTNSTGAGLGGTNVTFYFRTTVDVPFNPAGATFTIRAYVDDGAILYINGTEAWRYDMTNAAGYTVFADRALTEPNPNPVNTYVVTNITGLAQGNNVIAVEVHQDAVASSDVDWGMQLEANVSDFNATGGGTGPALHISRNGDQVTVTWTGAGVLQEATDLLNGGATAWTDVVGNPGSGYTTTAAGPRKFYRLRVPTP